MRSWFVAAAAVTAADAAGRCAGPPDGSEFVKRTRFSLTANGSWWCASLGGPDLYACEEAVQRALLGAAAAPARHGCDLAAPAASAVAVGSRDTVPNGQTWAAVRWATYAGGRVLVHDPAGALFGAARLDPAAAARDPPRRLDPGVGDAVFGASKWGLFFHDGADATRGAATAAPYASAACDVAFHERTYLINILTWQVGHLLVDVLESATPASRISSFLLR